LGFSGKWCADRSGQATALPRMRHLVQPADEAVHRVPKDATDAKQGADGDRPTGLDLLPVTGGESVTNHILLAVARALT
jgi:hypothetical protein